MVGDSVTRDLFEDLVTVLYGSNRTLYRKPEMWLHSYVLHRIHVSVTQVVEYINYDYVKRISQLPLGVWGEHDVVVLNAGRWDLAYHLYKDTLRDASLTADWLSKAGVARVVYTTSTPFAVGRFGPRNQGVAAWNRDSTKIFSARNITVHDTWPVAYTRGDCAPDSTHYRGCEGVVTKTLLNNLLNVLCNE